MKKITTVLLLFTISFIFSQKPVTYTVKNLSINNERNNFSTAFYGKNIVFSSESKDLLNLYKGIVKDGDVKIKTLFFKTNTHVSDPVFTNDLKTMYFTRSLYGEVNTIKSQKDKREVIAIFKATKASDGSWGNIATLPFNSEKYDVGHPALSSDNKKLYFTSNMPGTIGKTDIFVVDILGNNTYSKPQNLGNQINTSSNELHLFISKSNKLYFSSTKKGGYGGMDIYMYDLNKQAKPKLLPKPINSAQDDFSFIVDDATKTGFLSSNRYGGKGGDDIYSFKVKQKEKCTQKVIGTVYLNATQRRVSGVLVKLSNKQSNKTLKTFQTTKTGKYNFELKCGVDYKIEASKVGYQNINRTIKTTNKAKAIIKKNIFLSPKLKKGEKRKYLFIGSVDFEYNEWKLLPRFSYELDKAVLAMNKNPKLVIHFESHTDSRAPSDFNMELSEKRIEVLKEYLGFKGIFRRRVTGTAYGETKPVNKCVKGVVCTDEEYLENRRTTFILKEKQ